MLVPPDILLCFILFLKDYSVKGPTDHLVAQPEGSMAHTTFPELRKDPVSNAVMGSWPHTQGIPHRSRLYTLGREGKGKHMSPDTTLRI